MTLIPPSVLKYFLFNQTPSSPFSRTRIEGTVARTKVIIREEETPTISPGNIKKCFKRRRRKDLSFCHQFKFLNPHIFATQCRSYLKFLTINSVRPNSLSLKYQRFAPSYCKDIDIKKFEFAAKTQFL